MSELRQNLATREWVIIAPERLKGKPLQAQKNSLMDEIPDYDENCPFCPANEDRFENIQIEYIPHPDPDNKAGSPWLARCIENKYKIFQEYSSRPARPTEFEQQGIYCKFTGCGSHELVISSPDHNKTFATMSQHEVEAVVDLYLRRFNKYKENPNNLLTIIFMNHGPRSGASQIHPHSQIVSMRVVPNYLRFLLDEATRYFDTKGICVFCKIIDFELQRDERVVYQNERFMSCVPFAAAVPYEVNIFPKVHDSLLGDMSDEEAVEFSDCLRKTMRKLYLALSNPDFNMVFRNPSYHLSGVPFYHWHVQIVPHVRLAGGFELGSRIMVNIVEPEESARVLREIEV